MIRYLKYLMIFILIFSCKLRADEEYMNMPVEKQIMFFINIKKYDNNFEPGKKSKFRIGLFQSNDEKSIKYKDDFLKAFEEKYKEKSFFNLPLEVVVISDMKLLEAYDIDILIVTPGSEKHIDKVLEITQNRDIMSVTGEMEYLYSGISVIVGVDKNKPIIGVNLENAEKENSSFSTKMLRLAKIVKKN